MDRRCSISEARNNLPALVRDAELGSAVELTRRGRRVAVIISVHEYERMKSTRGAGLWESIARFRADHDLSELDVDDLLTDLRDPSPGREVAL